MKLNTLILAVCPLVLSSCGLMGTKGVEKEQISTDIANRSVKLNDGTEWFFKLDSQRCFAVNDDESQITASGADISVTVSSWKETGTGNNELYRTVFGKMLLHYKKDGGKWILESVEPQDLADKTLETEEFKKFLDIQRPVCKNFRQASW